MRQDSTAGHFLASRRAAMLGDAISVLRLYALLSLLGCLTLSACGEGTAPSSSAAAPAPGPVTRSEMSFVDTSRPTAPNGNYAGAPERTLRTVVWQPASSQPLPLFVMAHGFSGLPEDYDAVAPTIAAAGFAVALPAFPLTNANAPGGYRHALADVVNQPADVSFVISQLLDANTGAGDLHGRINADQIAVLGHSLGGATVTVLTRKDCCRDTRVRGAILFAPAPLDFFGPLFDTQPITAGPPTLLVNGTVDMAVAYSATQALYAHIDPPKFLLGITGADHTNALNGHTLPLSDLQTVSVRAIIGFLNALFRGQDAAFAQTLATLAAEGNRVTSDGTVPQSAF